MGRPVRDPRTGFPGFGVGIFLPLALRFSKWYTLSATNSVALRVYHHREENETSLYLRFWEGRDLRSMRGAGSMTRSLPSFTPPTLFELFAARSSSDQKRKERVLLFVSETTGKFIWQSQKAHKWR